MIPIAAFHGGLSLLKGQLNAPWGQCCKLNQVGALGPLLLLVGAGFLSILLGVQNWNAKLRLETSW